MDQDLTAKRLFRPSSDVMGSNRTGVRAHNERAILSLIHRNGPLAKADIARASGLSAQTVSVIMRNLEADGLLRRGEPVRGRVGQPSVPMDLDSEGAFAMGLKVGRRSLDMVLVDLRGKVRGRKRRTHRYPSPEATVQFADDAFGELSRKIPPAERHRLAGLGVALPFKLWEWGRRIDAPESAMEAWRDRDLGGDLADRLGCAVSLQNDANAACGAELTFGPRTLPRDFIHFYVAFFVGGGVVQSGHLLTGRTGNAGALGSIPVPSRGCTSGQLIDYASLVGLEQMLQQKGLPSDSLWGPPEDWEIDPDTTDAWLDDAAWGLAHAILATTAVTEAECVLIDGWLPDAVRAQLVDMTRDQITHLPRMGLDLPQIQAGTIGADGRALGAASLPIAERYFIDVPGATVDAQEL